MGKGYLNRCMDQLLKTRLCMNDAEQLSSTSFSMQLPNLRGESCDQAKAVLAGYQFQVISAGQAPDPDWEYRVAGTDPGSGAMISKTDSSILISCYEDLNIPAYLATVDCSRYEGTIAVYLQDQHKAACDCSEGKIWGKSGQRCIDCSRYENGVRNAFNAGDFNAAQQLAMECSGCPWSGSALAQIATARQQQACGQIVANMQAACANNNAAAASGFWKQASDSKCKIDPQLVQWASNLIDQHNQRVALQRQEDQRRQQAETQRQNQGDWMNVMSTVINGVQSIQQRSSMSQKPSRGSAPLPTADSIWSSHNSGSGNTGQSPEGNKVECQGHTMYCKSSVHGWTIGGNSTGEMNNISQDKNHDGLCDFCGKSLKHFEEHHPFGGILSDERDCRSVPW